MNILRCILLVLVMSLSLRPVMASETGVGMTAPATLHACAAMQGEAAPKHGQVPHTIQCAEHCAQSLPTAFVIPAGMQRSPVWFPTTPRLSVAMPTSPPYKPPRRV
jgi:hypothetical protein